MDGDGSDISSDLVRLAAPVLEGEADFVIGSRISGTREPGSMLLSQIFRWLAGRHADPMAAGPESTPTWGRCA